MDDRRFDCQASYQPIDPIYFGGSHLFAAENIQKDPVILLHGLILGVFL